MHVIAKKTLEEFWRIHPTAQSALETWYKIMTRSSFTTFSEIRQAFRSADYVAPYTIFDIGGNQFRIVAAIHYNRQKIYVRHLLTHTDYDRWCKKHRRR